MPKTKQSLPVCVDPTGFHSEESFNQHVRICGMIAHRDRPLLRQALAENPEIFAKVKARTQQGYATPSIPLAIIAACLIFGFGISLYGSQTVSPAKLKELSQDPCLHKQLFEVATLDLVTNNDVNTATRTCARQRALAEQQKNLTSAK